MKCPGCRSTETWTKETTDHGPFVMRLQRCKACEGRWSTQETLVHDSFMQGSATLPVPHRQGSATPPVPQKGGKGVSESGSALVPSSPESGPLQKISGDRRLNGAGGGHPGFDDFWALFPRRVGKAAAKRAWDRQKPPVDVVQVTLAWQIDLWDDPKFVPHPATWLNQGRWADEKPVQLVPRKPPGGGGSGGASGRREDDQTRAIASLLGGGSHGSR